MIMTLMIALIWASTSASPIASGPTEAQARSQESDADGFRRTAAELEREWAERKAKSGANHPEALRLMNNLGMAYLREGQTAKAVDLLERALAACKKRLRASHSNTALCMANLASAYQAVGRLDEAIPLFEQAIEARKADLERDQPGALAILNNLGVAQRDAGRPERAIPSLERALKGLEATLGKDDPQVLSVTENLAETYRAAGKPDQAIPMFERALAARKRKPGASDIDSIRSIGGLAASRGDAGRFAEAEPLFKELAALQRQVRPGQPIALAEALSGLGWVRMRRQRFAEAEAPLRECVMLWERQAPTDWRAAYAQALLGAALLGQSQLAEAETRLLRGYEGMKRAEARIPAANRSWIRNVAERLVKLYEAMGKPDEAAKWRRELDARASGIMREDVRRRPSGPEVVEDGDALTHFKSKRRRPQVPIRPFRDGLRLRALAAADRVWILGTKKNARGTWAHNLI